MLYDSRELNTAKQAQSAVHQYGREGMLSELYGVTGWEFDFRGHKLAGDWQAALGVTVRVHHLTWTSRLNTVLSRGKAVVKVGVIHPIESYWLYWGNKEQTQGLRDEMDERFKKLTDEAFFVGKVKYETILVPNCLTLRSSTLERLKVFQKKGEELSFWENFPGLLML